MQTGAGSDEKRKPGFKTNARQLWPLARARHVPLLLDFIAAARSAFARLVPPGRATKRQAQGKGAAGRTPMRRSDLHRARSKQAKLARLKSRARKITPKRPGDPDPTELSPR